MHAWYGMLYHNMCMFAQHIYSTIIYAYMLVLVHVCLPYLDIKLPVCLVYSDDG